MDLLQCKSNGVRFQIKHITASRINNHTQQYIEWRYDIIIGAFVAFRIYPVTFDIAVG